jgi:hypothetical protein
LSQVGQNSVRHAFVTQSPVGLPPVHESSQNVSFMLTEKQFVSVLAVVEDVSVVVESVVSVPVVTEVVLTEVVLTDVVETLVVLAVVVVESVVMEPVVPLVVLSVVVMVLVEVVFEVVLEVNEDSVVEVRDSVSVMVVGQTPLVGGTEDGTPNVHSTS